MKKVKVIDAHGSLILSSLRPLPRGRALPKFYKAFGDSEKNFSVDAYIVEGFEGNLLEDDGLLEGKRTIGGLEGRGTITRRNTYVWPKLSGFATWRQQLVSQKVH